MYATVLLTSTWRNIYCAKMFRYFKWDQWELLFKNVEIYSVILALLNVTFSIRSRFQINNDSSTVYGLYFMKEIICVNSSG